MVGSVAHPTLSKVKSMKLKRSLPVYFTFQFMNTYLCAN